MVFCGVFGAFVGWARNRSDLTGALHYHYMEAIACFAVAFGAFTSVLFDPFVAIPFFTALAIMFATRGRMSYGARSPDGALPAV